MGNDLPRLPLGLSDFANMREAGANYLYVDKTHWLAEMLNVGKYLFFSRPRRFGKSLLCSTIKYLYQGRRELFQGLAIEPLWDWSKTNPVVHLSLTDIGAPSPDKLNVNLRKLLKDEARKHSLEMDEDDTPRALILLLRGIHEKTGRRVVVIVDEYEKPVHDHIDDLPLARQLRDVLAAFYGSMKGCDSDIEKLFVTGVGRMVKTSIFSGFNQMIDLTLDEATGELCGYTDTELRHYFAPFINSLAQHNQMSAEQSLVNLRERYNGYWWGYGNKLYNPWAILNCVRSRRFENFWWASGTPSTLIKLIPSLREPEDMDLVEATDLELLFDLENIKAEPLLWQTGYLTITQRKKGFYTLGFPNAEVREAWFGMVLDRFATASQGRTSGRTAAARVLMALEEGDRQQCGKSLTTLFAAIPYQLQVERESFYHAVFVAALQAAGGRLIAELATDKGRVDAVLKTPNYIYVIEFKLGSAVDALAQIRDRRYYESFIADSRKIVLLGAGGFAERNIQCLWEEVQR